jgi:SAM-dependent methyltransferase
MSGNTPCPCPICHNAIGLTYLWNTQIVRCPRCRLAYVDRLPTVDELRRIYDEQYFNGATYTDYQADKAGTQLNFRQRLNTLLRYAERRDALFEIGSAYGFFLELAREHWQRVEGVEFTPDGAAHARDVLGLNVRQGDVESYPPAANSFDAVVMWDTIEHLYDPALAVRASAEALRPGGLLALTTGDIEALLPRLRGPSWRLIIPQHLYYFSVKSLTWLFETHGLDVVHVSHVGYYRSLNEMTKVLTWRHEGSAWRQQTRRLLQRLPLMNAQIPLNLYDILFVIGRKRATGTS